MNKRTYPHVKAPPAIAHKYNFTLGNKIGACLGMRHAPIKFKQALRLLKLQIPLYLVKYRLVGGRQKVHLVGPEFGLQVAVLVLQHMIQV